MKMIEAMTQREPNYAHTLLPLDLNKSFLAVVVGAVANITLFDKIACDDESEELILKTRDLRTHRQKFTAWMQEKGVKEGWSEAKAAKVVALMKSRPPDRIYRIRGGAHSALRGIPPIGVVVGYEPGDQDGDAAMAVIVVLGVTGDGFGGLARPLRVFEDGLEDVTEQARDGTLRELTVPYL